jgi:hypothetical protein
MPIFRCSLVYEYTAFEPSITTPTPFCEARVFIFKDRPLSVFEYRRIYNVLKAILDRLHYTFGYLSWSEVMTRSTTHEEREEANFPIRGKIATEVHGFEVEEVDLDEVAQYFRSNGVPEVPKVIPFDIPFRYVCYYDEHGLPKAEYNEWDIQRMESSIDVEMRMMGYRIIQFLQEEYFPALRIVEELTRKYEEMFRMIRV